MVEKTDKEYAISQQTCFSQSDGRKTERKIVMNQQEEKKYSADRTKESLGQKLKYCREQRGLTQEELAEKIFITRQAISNYERDKTLPDVYTLKKIAAIFDMSLDEIMEHTKEAEVTMPKAPGYLAAATLGAILLYLIAGGMTGHLHGELVVEMVIIGIFCQLFLHIFFSSAVKTGNFSMLAGFDSKVEYNRNEVKKVLVQMDIHIACVSFGVVVLSGISGFLPEKQRQAASICLLLMYCVEFTVALMMYNYRSIDRTLVQEKDKKMTRAGFISEMWFVGWVFGFVGVTIAKFMLFSIKNNSIEAVGYLGWMFLFLLITMAELFYEQHRVKVEIEKTGAYTPGKLFWTGSIAAAAVTVLMFLY